MQRAQLATIAPSAPFSMKAIWQTIRSYILWQHERGTLHYDVMVTLILIFIFFSPRVINFNDKPTVRNSHPTGVFVTPGAQGQLVYQIEAGTISPGDDSSMREQFLRVIEPISGKVAIVNYAAITDRKGHVQSYKVVAQRR